MTGVIRLNCEPDTGAILPFSRSPSSTTTDSQPARERRLNGKAIDRGPFLGRAIAVGPRGPGERRSNLTRTNSARQHGERESFPTRSRRSQQHHPKSKVFADGHQPLTLDAAATRRTTGTRPARDEPRPGDCRTFERMRVSWMVRVSGSARLLAQRLAPGEATRCEHAKQQTKRHGWQHTKHAG